MNAQQILNKARAEGWALGAFNAGNLEILKAVVAAAQSQNSPVIAETSSGEAEYFGMKNFLSVVENFSQLDPAPAGQVLTNFDHGPGLEECQNAIEAGYKMVHFDGSGLPYEENLKITKALVAQAHQKGILVEGEIDRIGGESKAHEELAESVQATVNYTDPQKAADFAAQSGVDILAVFVGNLHGVYKTPKKLDLERLRMVRSLTTCPFSLHGGSTLLEADIRAAISLGVVKINVNTELRLAFRQTLENVLRGSDEAAVYKIMPPVMAAIQKVVEEKIKLFGSSGKLA